MTFDSTNLVISFLFGMIGMGYFMYGKKQKQIAALLAGIGLMAFPYFVDNTSMMFVAGGALMAVPFIIKF